MGIHVVLGVRWNAVDPAVWGAVYDETLTLLQAHPSQLLGFARRPLLGRRVTMYTKAIEQDHGAERRWSVAGDRRSMRFAEVFSLLRAHPGRRSRQGELRVDDADEAGDADLVLQDPELRRADRMFGARTQGEPYHLPVVAAGLVVEARLPGSALLWGDIDEADARKAKQWAEEILGRELPMPVLLDAPALLRRLSRRWTGEALIHAFVRRFLGEPAAGLASALAAVERPDAEAYLQRCLCRRDPRDDGGPALVDGVRGWLLATGDVARLCALSRAAMPAAEIAELIARAGALIPPELRERAARCKEIPLPSRPDVSSLSLRGFLRAVSLDRDWGGPAFSEGALESALSQAYPGRGAELLAYVREESRQFEGLVARCCDAVEEAARLMAEIEPYQDVGELVALRSADELLPRSRQRLAAFAYALRCAQEAGRQARSGLPREPAAVRSLLVQIASERGPTLTEHAWGWILEEGDPGVLGVLLDLFCCEPTSEEGWRLRRAIVESRVLSAEVARMLGDEAVLAEGKALVEAARREQELGRERGPGAQAGGVQSA